MMTCNTINCHNYYPVRIVSCMYVIHVPGYMYDVCHVNVNNLHDIDIM